MPNLISSVFSALLTKGFFIALGVFLSQNLVLTFGVVLIVCLIIGGLSYDIFRRMKQLIPSRDKRKEPLSDVSTKSVILQECLADKFVLVVGEGAAFKTSCEKIALYQPKWLYTVSHWNKDQLEQIIKDYRPEVILYLSGQQLDSGNEGTSISFVENHILQPLKTLEIACAYGIKQFVYVDSIPEMDVTTYPGATSWVGKRIIQQVTTDFQIASLYVAFKELSAIDEALRPIWLKDANEMRYPEIKETDLKMLARAVQAGETGLLHMIIKRMVPEYDWEAPCMQCHKKIQKSS